MLHKVIILKKITYVSVSLKLMIITDVIYTQT